MSGERSILMSFDVEEFDMPLEYGQKIDRAEQMTAGYNGLVLIKQLLSAMEIRTTLFTTANFALNYTDIIKELSNNHEIASHTYYHSSFETSHLRDSRIELEKITGKNVTGLRMPRMRNVPVADVLNAGYSYDSSINPIWLPGRYNNLKRPRRMFVEEGLVRIPASVSTFFRIPLFWLGFKNLPYKMFLSLAIRALRKDGYVCLYFHPWEFIDLGKYKLPGYAKKPSGDLLLKRLTRLISDLKKQGPFLSMQDFLRI